MKAEVRATFTKLLSRFQSIYDTHTAFVQAFILFTAFRLFALFFLLPGGFIDINGGADVHIYERIGALAAAGKFPFIDYWMEYPPPFPWLSIAAYKLSLLFPPWLQRRLWFNTILHLFTVPFDMGSLVLVYAIVKRLYDKVAANRAAFAFALMFGPLFVFLGWFDNVQLFFILLGLYGLTISSVVVTGLGIGLGIGIKLFTLSLIPASVRAFSSPKRLLLLLGLIVLCVVVIFGPFMILSPDYTVAFVKSLSGRVSWQSIWALLDGNRGFGAVAPLGIRNDPASTSWQVPDSNISTLPWGWITLAFGALGLFLWTRPIDWKDARRSTAFAGLTLGMMLLYMKGYSPQWGTYLATIAIILFPGMRGIVYGVAYSATMIADWPVLVWLIPNLEIGLTSVIIVRTALTAALCLDCLALVFPQVKPLKTTQRIAMPLVVTGGAVTLLAILGPAYRAYLAHQLEVEPLAPVVESFRATGDEAVPVIVIQSTLLERLNPYLPGGSVRYLPHEKGTDGDYVLWVDLEDWLQEQVAGEDQAWVVFDNSDEFHREMYNGVRVWFDQHGCPIEQVWYDNNWVGHYAVVPTPANQPVEAGFVGGIVLDTAAIPTKPQNPGEAFCLQLSWEAETALPADYVVFVHIISSDGVLAAQNDLYPVVPTSVWKDGQIVVTSHGLFLPNDLTPGEYALQVGMYNPGDGVRLPLIDGQESLTISTLSIQVPGP